MRVTDTHVYFYGGTFSNWYRATFVDDTMGKTFFNSEQAFMFCKAKLFGDVRSQELIANTTNPAEAKARGRAVRDFDKAKWDEASFAFMVYVNYLKYSQNPTLAKQLLDTGEKTLVEASIEDRVWGVGLEADDDAILDEKNWLGKNLLGKALMEVRDLLWQDIKGQKEPGHL